MNGISGKTALVTAGSRGIGRAIALRLGAEGPAVAVNYLANDTAAKEVVTSISDAGGRAVAIQADMGAPADIRALYARVIEQFGALDIVVNNHAHIVFGPLVDIEEADYDRVFAVTAKGTFVSLQEAARSISDGGRIINVSAGGTLTIPQQMLDELVAQTTLGRLGEPADVADVVVFLASAEARWLTGQLVRAGGGLM